MADKKSPRGLLVDLVTPLRSDGSLDGRSLGRLLDRVAPHCQAVVLATPRVGEGIHLPLDTRARLLEDTLVVLRGRKPVLIWVTGEDENLTRENLQTLNRLRLKHAPAQPVFFLDSPLFYHSNRGLADLYQTWGALTAEAPFVLHNDPTLISGRAHKLKRNNIRTAILKSLSGMPGVKGLIYHGPLERAQGYQKAVRAHPDFRIYDGDEGHFLDYPSMSGVVSCGANLDPAGWLAITESSLHLEGSPKNYPDFLRQIWELGNSLRLLKKCYDPSPGAVIKAALARQGLIQDPFTHAPYAGADSLAADISGLMKKSG